MSLTNKIPVINRLSSRGIFFLSFVTLLIVVSSYIYLANKMIWNAFVVENTETEIIKEKTKLSELEFAYITAKNNVTMERATALGFVESVDTKYLARTGSKPSLSLSR